MTDSNDYKENKSNSSFFKAERKELSTNSQHKVDFYVESHKQSHKPFYANHHKQRVIRQFHPNKFIHLSASSNVHKFSFVPRTLKDWNNLSNEVTTLIACEQALGSFVHRLLL